MKKNLIAVVILVLVMANLTLTAILTISILPQTKKANELITQVCSAIELELKSGSVNPNTVDIPIDQVVTYDLPEMTINLKKGEDGKQHYAIVTVSISMNKEGEGYKEYGETIAEKESLIKSQINAVISNCTYEEFTQDQKAVQDEILSELQTLFNSDFIVSVGFSTVTSQ